jgi:hypothetical protein
MDVYENKPNSIKVNKNTEKIDKASKPRNNYEALTSPKKPSPKSDYMFENRSDRYNSFARNYQQSDKDLSRSHDPNSLRRKLSQAGSDIMSNREPSKFNNNLRSQMSNPAFPNNIKMMKEAPKNHQRPSKVSDPIVNSSFNFSGIASSSSSKTNPSPYSAMKNNTEMHKEQHKKSFKSAKHMDNIVDVRLSGKNHPVFRNSPANENEFSNTAVSTPIYNKDNFRSDISPILHNLNSPSRFRASDKFTQDKQRIDNELTILRRSMQINQGLRSIQKRNSNADLNHRGGTVLNKTLPKKTYSAVDRY